MKRIKILATAVVLAAGICFFTGNTTVLAEVSEDVTIEQGVYIGGIDVGGMTAAEAQSTVDSYLESMKAQTITLIGPNANLELTIEEMGITAQTQQAVEEAASLGHSGNLITRFKELEDLEKEDYVIDMGLSIDKQGVAEFLYSKSSKTNIKAVDNGLKLENGQFVYVEGQSGDEVDIVTAVNELNEHIHTDWEQAFIENDEFKLSSIVSTPRGTKEELMAVKDLLGTYTTNYTTSSAGRVTNLENGVSKISGTVLFPGDELSVYALASPFTKENGYELASAYSNGNVIESFGGGICQVSTTLYNAALYAELEITQRYNHSMTVTYVPLAADAAIAGTYKDLRIKNNYDYPIYIQGTCSNKNLTFNIYGVEYRASNRKVSYESVTLETRDPLTEFTLDPSQALGVYKKTKSEYIGYTAELYKVVKVDGVEQERTRVNRSSYQASAGRVTIGTAGATAEQVAAINAAIATGDDATVQATVTALATPPVVEQTPVVTPTPEQTQTPETTQTPEQTQTPETENPSETTETDTTDTGATDNSAETN